MRVVFLNRFYWPDEPATAQLLTDLTERLAARGQVVLVVTSHPGDARVPRKEERNGVSIVRLGRSRAKGDGLASKAANWGSYLAAATGWLARNLRATDTVVAMTDPPILGVGAGLVCALRGCRLIHWVQDIYPELAIELTHHSWLRVVRPLRNMAWRRADVCVTLGTDMAQVLAANGVASARIKRVPNWPPAGLAPPLPAAVEELRQTWGLTGKFVVAYSGNLGRVHDLGPVLDLAQELRADDGIVFLFVGGGAQRASLESDVVRRQLTNVHFRPAQPRAQLSTSLGVGDAHLVTLLPGCERFVFPSKFYGVIAIGRPVVFIGPAQCEIARLVRDGDLGIAGDRGAIKTMAAELRSLAADAGRLARHRAAALRFAADSGNVHTAADRWSALLSAEGLSAAPLNG